MAVRRCAPQQQAELLSLYPAATEAQQAQQAAGAHRSSSRLRYCHCKQQQDQRHSRLSRQQGWHGGKEGKGGPQQQQAGDQRPLFLESWVPRFWKAGPPPMLHSLALFLVLVLVVLCEQDVLLWVISLQGDLRPAWEITREFAACTVH